MSNFAIVKTAKGVEFKVSPEDFDCVAAFPWHVRNRGYVARTIRCENGRRRQLHLHRFILGVDDAGVMVDHINGDPLDNRRENLRVCSNSANQHNQGLNKRNTTGYKGVCFYKKSGKYRAQIKHQMARHFLGEFRTPEEAAHAYNKAAIRLHGDFAVLNPVGGTFMSASKEDAPD